MSANLFLHEKVINKLYGSVTSKQKIIFYNRSQRVEYYLRLLDSKWNKNTSIYKLCLFCTLKCCLQRYK